MTRARSVLPHPGGAIEEHAPRPVAAGFESDLGMDEAGDEGFDLALGRSQTDHVVEREPADRDSMGLDPDRRQCGREHLFVHKGRPE
jgi:hypothetical protein